MTTDKIIIAPSILAADFSRLGEELVDAERCGADWIHLDVMDGRFVPNITIGAPVVGNLRKRCSLPFDVHLMISEPLKYVDDFAGAGADIITFHAESDSDVGATIALIRGRGLIPGLALKPAAVAETVFPYLESLGMVLIMTVEPGFGGQTFMKDMTKKVRAVRREAVRRGLDLRIQVDGGINSGNIALAAEAGADAFVAGTSFFKSGDRAAEIKKLRDAARRSLF